MGGWGIVLLEVEQCVLLVGLQVGGTLFHPPSSRFHFSQVDSAWAAGDREGSRRYSSAARGWNIAGMVVGVVLYVCVIIGAVVGSVA